MTFGDTDSTTFKRINSKTEINSDTYCAFPVSTPGSFWDFWESDYFSSTCIYIYIYCFYSTTVLCFTYQKCIKSFLCRAWMYFIMPLYATCIILFRKESFNPWINVWIWISSAPPIPGESSCCITDWISMAAPELQGTASSSCTEGILRGNWTMKSQRDTKATALSDSDRSVWIILCHVAKYMTLLREGKVTSL